MPAPYTLGWWCEQTDRLFGDHCSRPVRQRRRGSIAPSAVGGAKWLLVRIPWDGRRWRRRKVSTVRARAASTAGGGIAEIRVHSREPRVSINACVCMCVCDILAASVSVLYWRRRALVRRILRFRRVFFVSPRRIAHFEIFSSSPPLRGVFLCRRSRDGVWRHSTEFTTSHVTVSVSVCHHYSLLT